jgi:hypothetical protein
MLGSEQLLTAENRFSDSVRQLDLEFGALEAAGVTWARQGIPWEQIETKPGKWDWSAADAVVQAAKRHHVSLLWLVGNTAPWDSDNGQWSGAPKDLQNPKGHFPQFVRKLVSRYKGTVRHWEIRNEPNLDHNWQGHDADKYAVYLAQAYDQIKQADPGATAVCGGLGGGVPEQTAWLKDLLAAVHRRNRRIPFDVAAFHVYGGQADRKFTGHGAIAKYLEWCDDEITQALQAEGLASTPVWFTEFNYPAAMEYQTFDLDFHDGDSSQAKFVTEMLPRLIARHPERKIFWASLADDFDETGAFGSTGLLHSDKQHNLGAPRPSYEALRRLLKFCHSAREGKLDQN